jgi:pimeloyl-ACP methyl ester carboxylesterase
LNSRSWKIFIALAALAAAHCNTTDHTRRGYLRTLASSYDPPPRPVVIVPGFGVTRLYDPVARRFVWGTPRATVQTHFPDDLDLPAEGHDRLVPRGYVGSRGPVNIGWQLREGLRKFGAYTPEQDVFMFEYDWRLPARESAARLGELIERVRGNGKVDVVTHSAGAMVALAYVKLAGGAKNVEHLVLIAPTQRGVVDAFRVFVRPERFLRRSFEPETVATWPFVTELLPQDGRFLVEEEGQPIARDLWKPEDWQGVIRAPLATSLQRARRFRDELDAAPMPREVQVRVIAGDCVPTARRVLMRRDGTFAFYPSDLRPGEEHLAKLLFEPGDGTVPISSARAGGEAEIFCDGHQGIAADPSMHRALIRTLREE